MAKPRPDRPIVFPVLMVVAGLALIIGSIWWTLSVQSAGGANSAADLPVSTRPLTGGIPTPPAVRIPFPKVPRISVAEAKSALDGGQAVFVDTRGEQYYITGHIPGALVMEADRLPGEVLALDKATWIITYCT